jgi:hypothetical protein
MKYRLLMLAWGLVLVFPVEAQSEYTISGKPPGSVTIKQTSDQGALSVRIGGGELEVSDGFGPTVLPGVPKNIKVRMLPVQGTLGIDLDMELPGNLDLQLEDTEVVNFTGSNNRVGAISRSRRSQASRRSTSPRATGFPW